MSARSTSDKLAPVVSLQDHRRRRTDSAERAANLYWVDPKSDARVGPDPGVLLLMHSPQDEEAQSARPRPCAAVLLNGSEVCHIAALFAHYPEPDAAVPFAVSRGGVWMKITQAGTDSTGYVYNSECGLVGDNQARYRLFIAKRRLLNACRKLYATIRQRIPVSNDVEDLLLYLDTRISTLDLITRHMP